ncbi:MAG: TlpA family protein disulfide reductase [Hydrogenibacillus schlegelii]|nr:TlpA family protein disulfide reductase [Hydrogenibacillus schlegelii]
MKRTVVSVLALLLLLGVAIYWNTREGVRTAREVRAEEGYRAPGFTIEALDGGGVLDVGALIGQKPIFINFWESWCPPCRAEMPYLQKAYEEYGQDVVFVMINPMTSDTLANAKAFLAEERYTFPVYLDDKDGSVTRLYRVGAFPTSFFIDRNGVIIARHMGAMSEEVVETLMKKIARP